MGPTAQSSPPRWPTTTARDIIVNIPSLLILKYIYTVACTLNSRLLSGHLGVVAGTLRGFFFLVRYDSVGVQLTRLHALCQGTLTSECVWKNLNATVWGANPTLYTRKKLSGLFEKFLKVQLEKKKGGGSAPGCRASKLLDFRPLLHLFLEAVSLHPGTCWIFILCMNFHTGSGQCIVTSNFHLL